LDEGSALWQCGLQGFEVREQRLVQGLGTPTRAGRVPREAERLEPATLAEGVEREELWLRGAVRVANRRGFVTALPKKWSARRRCRLKLVWMKSTNRGW
jgi:hypothetical protein